MGLEPTTVAFTNTTAPLRYDDGFKNNKVCTYSTSGLNKKCYILPNLYNYFGRII